MGVEDQRKTGKA